MSEPKKEPRSAVELAGDVTLFAELNEVLVKRVHCREDAIASIYALTRLAVCMAAVGTNQDEEAARDTLVLSLNMNLKNHFKFVKEQKP